MPIALEPEQEVRRRDPGGDAHLDHMGRPKQADEPVELERGIDLNIGAPTHVAMHAVEMPKECALVLGHFDGPARPSERDVGELRDPRGVGIFLDSHRG
jgi:hypothetical protein